MSRTSRELDGGGGRSLELRIQWGILYIFLRPACSIES